MRLLVHVEGQTEETFVNEILRTHLFAYGYTSVGARLIGNARLRVKRGGIRAWSSVKADILRHLKEDVNAISTLMVDYYAMPSDGQRGWPGRVAKASLSSAEKAEQVEKAISAEIELESPGILAAQRFIPFVLMHEFEGLLFSDCAAFARGVGQHGLAKAFAEIRDAFATPEDINDSPLTTPSKRIEGLVLGYEKPLHGALAVLEIGLKSIRVQCPHFDGWLTKLEELPAVKAGG
jgi:hypothetical protein